MGAPNAINTTLYDKLSFNFLRDIAPVASISRELPADASQAEVEAVVHELNTDPACTGFIVQLPLPDHLDANRILELIDPAKDVDGLHPVNLGRLVLGVPAFLWFQKRTAAFRG